MSGCGEQPSLARLAAPLRQHLTDIHAYSSEVVCTYAAAVSNQKLLSVVPETTVGTVSLP